MELSTMVMDRDEARSKYVEYRDHVRKTGDAVCAEIIRGYRAMSKGLQVIDLVQAMQAGGVKSSTDRRGNGIALPALAVMRADAAVCHLSVGRWTDQLCIYTARESWGGGRHTKGTRMEFTIDGARTLHGSEFKSPVPHIPPRLLPKYSLSNYHVLWEADWKEYPADPALLQHLGGDLYVVLGVWDLTVLERTVLRPRPVMKRGKPLKQIGRRAKRDADEREEIRVEVLGECGQRCVGQVAAPSVKCWGRLEVHEVVDRSVRPGVHLDADFGVALCAAHHQAVSDDASWGREVGLSFYSWQWEATLARVKELRAMVWRF